MARDEIFDFTLQEFGNILLAVSYLPTAQRLTINVMKARDVKFTPTVSNLNDFSKRHASLKLIFLNVVHHCLLLSGFYVRVLMLNGRTGQRMKKKRTKFVTANSQPEFNETLTFDVSYNQLDIVQFLVVLCSRVCIYSDDNLQHAE